MAAARKPRAARSAARKPARAAPRARPKARATTGTKPARKAFGGYAISFSGRRETLEQVFGKRPIPPSDMNKKIWAFIRAHGLAPPKRS